MIIVHDFFSQNGGGENLIFSIAKELNIKIFTSYNTKKKNNLIVQSKYHYLLRKSRIFVFLFFKFFFRKKINETILFSGNHCCFSISNCDAKYKILYAHSLPKIIFADLYMDHNDSFLARLFKKTQISQYKKNLYCLDKIIFNSNKTKLKFFHVFKDLEKKIDHEVIYPFSDLEFRPEEVYTLKKNKYFVVNSRHHQYKNINHILDLLHSFLKENPDINIFITQEGKITDKLIFSHDQSNQIHFTGYLDFQEYQSLLLSSVGIIFPSRDEDFGISALDAYNLNIPVLVQKNCGFSEILPDHYNYFYDDKNLVEIMTKLTSLSVNDNIIYKNKKDYKKTLINKLKLLPNNG